MEIKITGLKELKDNLGNYAKNLPFAVSKAINDTMYQVREAEIREMKVALDRPTPFILKSVVYRKSTKKDLTAVVALSDPRKFVGDIVGGAIKMRADQTGGPPPEALVPQVFGGSRKLKQFERLLQQIGVLPPNMMAVPARGAWLDQHGNIPYGEIVKILSDLQAHQAAAGYNINRRGKSKGYYRNFRYFVMRRGGLAVGIYAQELRSQSIQPIMAFVKKAHYKRRFDFYLVGQNTVFRHLNKNLQAALEYALRTSR